MWRPRCSPPPSPHTRARSSPTPLREAAPARLVALAGGLGEQVLERQARRRLGMVGEPLSRGRAGRFFKAARWSSTAGLALLGASALRRSRTLDIAGGVALAATSLLTRFGYFHAGVDSATDPRYTVVPQRERLAAKGASLDGTALDG